VYYLNYAWDGSSIGAPESQVDAFGNRVWSLKPDSDNNGNTEQLYSNQALKQTKTRKWGLFACHKLFDTGYTYSGRSISLFEHGLSKDSMPKAYYNYTTEPLRSYSVSVGANGIPTDFYKFIISHNTNYPYSGGTTTAIGIFDSLKDFPYRTNGEALGALYYSEAISYTLTTANWWLQPEYDASGASNRTFTYTDTSGATVNRTISMWMVFIPETFLGRTFTGAFRVYRRAGYPTQLIERFELDSVTPNLITD
jgi:hypothetical protein